MASWVVLVLKGALSVKEAAGLQRKVNKEKSKAKIGRSANMTLFLERSLPNEKEPQHAKAAKNRTIDAKGRSV